MFSAMQTLQLVKILYVRIDDREQSNISRIRKQPLVGIPTFYYSSCLHRTFLSGRCLHVGNRERVIHRAMKCLTFNLMHGA